MAADLHGRGAEVVAYDRRGFGETPGSESPFDHVDDLLAVLEAATDAPAWLVGNSQGGLIALDLALHSPERVAGLVLLAPAISGAPEEEDEDLDPTHPAARPGHRARRGIGRSGCWSTDWRSASGSMARPVRTDG